MPRRLILPVALVAALLLPGAAPAQDRAATLAEIRAELSVLAGEIQALRAELLAGGPEALQGAGGGTALNRLAAMEAALVRLTGQAEAMGNRIDRIVADATNRIGDLEFRLCELEQGCDVASLPITERLGGGPGMAAPGPAPLAPADPGSAPELAMSEQADYDAAVAAYEAGAYQDAADRFARFTQTYTGGPLTADAEFLQGEALAALGQTAAAARSYLDAFSGAPGGPRAPDSLLRLGQSLGELGQMQEACVTLMEVGIRFPGSAPAAEAEGSMRALGCQ